MVSTQFEQEEKIEKMKKSQEPKGKQQRFSILLIRAPRKEKCGAQRVSEKQWTDTSQMWKVKGINLHLQTAKPTSNGMNPWVSIPRHIPLSC